MTATEILEAISLLSALASSHNTPHIDIFRIDHDVALEVVAHMSKSVGESIMAQHFCSATGARSITVDVGSVSLSMFLV